MGKSKEEMEKDLQQQLAVSDVRIDYEATDYDGYELPIQSTGKNLTQREVVTAIVEDAIRRNQFPHQGGMDLEQIVDKLFEQAKKNGVPVIDWDSDNKTKTGRSYIEPDQYAPRGTKLKAEDGTFYEGYTVRVSPKLQAEIGNTILDAIGEKVVTRHEDMKKSIMELNELTAKLDKVAEYANDHTLHGLTQVYSPLLDNAGKNSQALKEYLRNQDYLKADDPMQALRDKVASEYKIFDNTHHNARNQKPDEIVARMTELSEHFKQQGEYMIQVISWLPGGGSGVAKIIGIGLEGREIFNEIASGKVTTQQAIEKRVEKVATDLLAGQIGKALGGGGGGTASDNIGVDKVKEFVSGVATEYLKKSVELYKKGAGADEYKTALADTLITNFAKTVGGSIKSIAGDDDAVKKLLDVAVKLGIEDQVKKVLDNAKKTENKETSALPQPLVDGVRDLKLAKVASEDDTFKVAGSLLATANREDVTVRRVAVTNDGQNVVGFDADPATNPGYKRTSPVNIDASLSQSREDVVASVDNSNRERERVNASVVQQPQPTRSAAIG